MGIKFLRLHTFPWCFHVMGNHFSCVHQPPSNPSCRTVKLIKSDGVVKIYHRPVNAAELMLEFPKHLICHSDSFLIGQKIPALSETDELKLGHKYFLLPNHFFQSVLSFVTIASFASAAPCSASSVLSEDQIAASSHSKKAFLKKAATCKPFEVHKTPSGTLQIRVSDEFIAQLMEEGRLKGEQEGTTSESAVSDGGHVKGKVCTTPQLQKDYTQLVGCRRSVQWKPKLETIREKERKRLGAFGIRRRRKSQTKLATNKSQRSEKKLPKVTKAAPSPPPPPPPPPPPTTTTTTKKSKSQRSDEKHSKVKAAPPPPPSPPPPPPPAAQSSRKIRLIRGKKGL